MRGRERENTCFTCLPECACRSCNSFNRSRLVIVTIFIPSLDVIQTVGHFVEAYLPFHRQQLSRLQLYTHSLLCGPLSDIPPRLRSGHRLPPQGVGLRSWEMDLTKPWRMMQRVCGAPTLSRASRKPWQSTHHVAVGRSSSLMRARCT
ncbi:hypothetical protein AMECASPLE_011740, partial [Ameca splendens]